MTALRPLVYRSLVISIVLALNPSQARAGAMAGPLAPYVLIGVGDSLTQGTMDGTDNALNTSHAYLENVAHALAQTLSVISVSPLLDFQGQRLSPFSVPTNLGVDGADSFSAVGLEYYKRAGASRSFFSLDLFADKLLPFPLTTKYDKVLYPINVLAGAPVSQLDAAAWLLKAMPTVGLEKALIVLWIGNNDSGAAALGSGGTNPTFVPIPVDQIQPVMPLIASLLRFGEALGVVSSTPYTPTHIERNLTALPDFLDQYLGLVARLGIGASTSKTSVELFLLTLPYYSSVGYLFDSEDLEFYLRKANPAYHVPPTFKRVGPPGAEITDPLAGDRVSLVTFGLMYALLDSGFSVDYVNQVLETNGQQRDGLVLSEEEQRQIIARIDGFNGAIWLAAALGGPHVHLVDVGSFLNDALTGKNPVRVAGRLLSRKWVRGGAFTLDGVHPGYTGQALIANFVLTQINEALHLHAPLYDLSAVLAGDPYIDHDGDGWAPGPTYPASGLTKLLFLFRDPDDGDPRVQPVLPPDVWNQISAALLEQLLRVPELRNEAARRGMLPAP